MSYVVDVIHPHRLSKQQTNVLVGLANAFSVKQIGKALAISDETVAKHCRVIYERMEVDQVRGDKRMYAVLKAISEGIIAIK